jgi:murein DD-endopeptidase MepM/ murein hydrolase activator NlpD
MKIDCVWVKLEDYYQIWDATYINPYQRSAASFNQSKEIQLFDGEKGLLWASPLEKTFITSGFGPRWGHFHGGIDLQLNVGTPIYAAFDGIVRISTFNRGYGNYVVLRHYNGLETLYGHMSALKVRSGQEVKAGQLIGLGGSTGWSTGPHLHFETLYAGHTFNPLEIYNINQRFQLRSDKFVLLPQHFAHLGNKMRLTLYHQVVPGETLQTISHKYNVPVTVLAQINQLTTSTTLRVGQRLRIR